MVKTLIAIILCLSVVAPVSAAGPVESKPAATQTKPAKPAKPVKPAKPDWAELTPAQKAVLAPLMQQWSSFDAASRKKWVKVANGYPKLKPDAQKRLQARMQHWAKLTPQQRQAAREKYLAIKKLPPEKRAEVKSQWQQYQQSLATQSVTGNPETTGNRETTGSPGATGSPEQAGGSSPQ